MKMSFTDKFLDIILTKKSLSKALVNFFGNDIDSRNRKDTQVEDNNLTIILIILEFNTRNNFQL
jgi:hypothetical protein